MAIPKGLAKPHRILALIPVLAAFLFVVGALAFALTHLDARGGARQATAPNSQIAAGKTLPSRDVHTAQAYTAPKMQ